MIKAKEVVILIVVVMLFIGGSIFIHTFSGDTDEKTYMSEEMEMLLSDKESHSFFSPATKMWNHYYYLYLENYDDVVYEVSVSYWLYDKLDKGVWVPVTFVIEGTDNYRLAIGYYDSAKEAWKNGTSSYVIK